MSSDELMAEVEATLKGAMKQVRQERRDEHLRVLKDLAASTQREGLVPQDQQVLLYIITQADITTLDPDKTVKPQELVGKTIEQLEHEGYTGGNVSYPFTFDTYEEAIDNLNSPASAVLADYAQGNHKWATVCCYKEQGTTTYLLVASNTITIHKLLPTGDTQSSYHDPDNSTGEAVEQALYTHGKAIAKAQYTFTAHVQVLKHQYPETYKAILKQVLKRMEQADEEEGDNE